MTYDMERSVFVKDTCIQTLVLFLLNIGFMIIGVLSNGYLQDEPHWDQGAWYKISTACFILSGFLSLNVFCFGCLGLGACNADKPLDPKEKTREAINFYMFLALIGSLISSVFLGNFIKESNVFVDCTYDKDKLTTYNNTLMNCFKEYNKIRGLAAFDIMFLILSLILIVDEIFKNKRNKETIIHGEATEKNEVASRLAVKGFLFFPLMAAFFTIGGIATETFKSESDGNKSYRLYLSAFLGGGMSFFVFIVLTNVAGRNKKGNRGTLLKIMKWFFPFLLVSFAVFIGGLVSVAYFVKDHSEFVKCPISNDTFVFTCLKNKDSLEKCSVACIILSVACFLTIIGIFQKYSKAKQSNTSKIGYGQRKTTNKVEAQEQAAKVQKKTELTNEVEKKDAKRKKKKAKKARKIAENKREEGKSNKDKVTFIAAESENKNKTRDQSNNKEIFFKEDFENKNKTKGCSVSTAIVAAKLEKQIQEENEIDKKSVNRGAWCTDSELEHFRYNSPTKNELVLRPSSIYNDYQPIHIQYPPEPPPVQIPDVVEFDSNPSPTLPLPPPYDDVIDQNHYFKTTN